MNIAELHTLLNELDPLPLSHTDSTADTDSSSVEVEPRHDEVFTAVTDRELLATLTNQLLAIVRPDNHAPFPPLTAPLTAAVYLVVGRLRALTDPVARAAAVEAAVAETKFGTVLAGR